MPSNSIQGLAEVAAFQQEARRDREFATRAQAYAQARMPFLRDLARQSALQEVATGLGGLAVAATGAALAQRDALDPGIVPLLTLLALSAFVPVWEIAQVGRQLADTFAATQRLHAIHAEPVAVMDGPGVSPDAPEEEVPALEAPGSLHVPRPPAAGPGRRLAVRTRRPHRGAGWALGCRKDDGRESLPALLGPG